MGNAIKFQNGYIFDARRSGCRAGFRVTIIPQSDLATEENASHFALFVALVCGQSRVTRRVYNRARVDVFWSLLSCIYMS